MTKVIPALCVYEWHHRVCERAWDKEYEVLLEVSDRLLTHSVILSKALPLQFLT